MINIKYQGSKSRIVKYILPIIQERIKDYNIKTYIDPFCGGANVVDKVQCENRIASDINKYLIELLKNADRIKEFPDEISKEHYSDVRDSYNNKDDRYEDWYKGAIGFLASYNGRFFDGGYAGIVTTKAGTIRNYYREARDNLLNQSENLKGIQFYCRDYKEYSRYEDCLFYCDPPYYGTKQYGINKSFDYAEFWDWVRNMNEKNIVLVSEHAAPNDFECIWEAPVKRTIDNTKRVDTVERLFEMRE